MFRKAFVLMTAMPPTLGHLHLIQFASGLAQRVTVIVTTQPGEPFCEQRYRAVEDAVPDNVDVVHLHRQLPQDPSTEGFWDLWKSIVGERGFLRFPAGPGDVFVTSEPYGARLADITGAAFMPYDPKRELFYTKATDIRENWYTFFENIAPTFQNYVRPTITLFGAESTGKTTLSKRLATGWNGHWLYEYARPYLEMVGPEITVASMNAIWQGQLAAQKHTQYWFNKPLLFQDTDLFSTVGYWEQPHWESELGPVPEGLIEDAIATRSDLYLITQSNIPFEADPIRYGGDHRESPDDYWIALADKYDLPYRVLTANTLTERMHEAGTHIETLIDKVQDTLRYDRKGM